MERFALRKQIEKDLDAAGLLEKTEDYTNNVGYSERTGVAIEPKLSMQWFLSMGQAGRTGDEGRPREGRIAPGLRPYYSYQRL